MQQNIWKTLLGDKKNKWFILLLVGILLVVISIPTKSNVDTDASYNGGTDVESRLENILSKMQGIGDVQVMITYQEDNQVEGVVVAAEGGGNSVIVRKITEVVQALFDVDSHKIKVIESNQNN